MSLNWDISKVKNKDDVCYERKTIDGVEDDYLSTVTEQLIWSTMIVDLPGITEANAAEVWERINMYEMCCGPMRYNYDTETKKRTPVYFTKKDILNHVGLSTNVSSKTRKQFLTKLGVFAIEHATGKRRISDQNAKGPLVPDEVKPAGLESTQSVS